MQTFRCLSVDARVRFQRGRPRKTIFSLGPKCIQKSYLYHCGWHFKYNLFEDICAHLREGNMTELLHDKSWLNHQFLRFEKCMEMAKSLNDPSIKVDWDLWGNEKKAEG